MIIVADKVIATYTISITLIVWTSRYTRICTALNIGKSAAKFAFYCSFQGWNIYKSSYFLFFHKFIFLVMGSIFIRLK